MTRDQLLERGLSPRAVEHRLASGRLHSVYRGVYAVGRPELTRHGRWMAAVLACGPGAALVDESAAALWAIRDAERGLIRVGVPAARRPTRPGIVVRRRAHLAQDVTHRLGIPLTSPTATLIDLAAHTERHDLEAAINAADKRDLIDPEALRRALDDTSPRPGTKRLRNLLDRHTFRLTDSELERRFLRIVRKAGLPMPQTRAVVDGFRVDFYWPEFDLVVETDGLRYHRTPAQQAADRVRDQAHAAAGRTTLRFTHAQIRYEPGHVEATLYASLNVRARWVASMPSTSATASPT